MKNVIEHFKYTIEKNRLSHLYILSGGSSLRQKRIVRELAFLIFAAANDNPSLKHQLETDNYPNFVYLAKDGQSIKKEQVLNLQKEFSKTSLVKGPRVYIVESADTMSHAAANSLLKFLEEPKDDQTVGFLLTEDQSLVLPTIKSRSQVILLEEETDEDFIKSLTDQQVPLKEAYYLTVLTKDYEEAMLLLEDAHFQKACQSFEGLLSHFLSPKVPLSLLMYDLERSFFDSKEWLIYIFELLSKVMLDIIHTHMNQKIDFEIHKESILSLVPMFSNKKAEKMIRLFYDTIKSFRLPVNVSMMLQATGIEIEGILKDDNA